MARVIFFMLFSFLYLISSKTFAMSYEVQSVSGTNVSKNIIDSVREYLIERVQELTNNEPASPHYKIKLKIIRFGRKAKLMIKVYDKNNRNVWSDSLSIANPDDLEKAVDLLAKSVVHRKKSATNYEISEITEYNTEAYNKRTANRSFFIKLGGAQIIPFSDKVESTFLPTFEVHWLYDMRDIIAGINIKSGSQEDNSLVDFGLYGLKPFSPNRNTFFLVQG